MFKKKKSSGAGSNFNAKEFMIQHVEKLIFGVVTLLSVGLVYLGTTAKSYPDSKTPQKLQGLATQVSENLKKPHWEEMVKAEPSERNVQVRFEADTIKGREPLDSAPYRAETLFPPPGDNGLRRGDPGLLAPSKLEVRYFYGAIAKLSDTDPLEKLEKEKILEDAKKPEKREPRPNAGGSGRPSGGRGGSSGGGGGSGGSGGSGSMGGGGSGSMAGGGSGGAGMLQGDTSGKRMLSGAYDEGYKRGMQTYVDNKMGAGAGTGMGSNTADADSKKLRVAEARGFVCVTALAPHEDLEKAYHKEFAGVNGYLPGRDNPIYQGIEVQRAEVKDPDKPVDEADWKVLPKTDKEDNLFKDYSKEFKDRWLKMWPGTCSEVHPVDWTDPNISMPIPPILLTDYRKYGTHSEIPTSNKPLAGDQDENSSASGGYGGMSGGSMSGGSMSGGSMSGGSMSGGSMSGGSMSGGSGGSGGSGSGSASMGRSGASGGSSGSMGGNGALGGEGTGTTLQVVDAPKKLPETKYKLVRFFDFTAKPDKIYRYRVRLLMYDPNFPEYASLQPLSSTLNKAALARVQPLLTQPDSKDSQKRVSRKPSEWSAPSDAIAINSPAKVHIGGENMSATYTRNTAGDWIESQSPRTEGVFVGFQAATALLVPFKNVVERGSVFELKKMIPEVVHPISKLIKTLKKTDSLPVVAVVDVRGLTPLAMGNASKDPIRSGMELAAFDSKTGQLIISREFDDFTSYHMFTQPDQPAVGPLGGSWKKESGTMGGDGGGAGDGLAGGMGSGGGSGSSMGGRGGRGGPGGGGPGGSGGSN